MTICTHTCIFAVFGVYLLHFCPSSVCFPVHGMLFVLLKLVLVNVLCHVLPYAISLDGSGRARSFLCHIIN